MVLVKKTDKFSMAGVSVAGGVAHNVGQIAVASVLLATNMAGYLPALLISGCVAGVLIGLLGSEVARRVHGIVQKL